MATLFAPLVFSAKARPCFHPMGKKNRRPPAAEPPEDAPLDEPAASEPDASDRVMTQFARNLATGNRKTRAQALGAVEKWLAGRGEGASELELRKLWRGIFFCVWMVDKAHVQLEVSRTIARLVHCFATPRARRALAALLGRDAARRVGQARQAPHRQVLHAHPPGRRRGRTRTRARAWAAGSRFEAFGALDADLVRQLPNGPRLHLADVLLEALGVADEAGGEVAADGDSGGDGEPGPARPCSCCGSSRSSQLALTADAPVVRRVLERLVRPLLEQCRRGREEPEAAERGTADSVAWLGARASRAAPATPDANRVSVRHGQAVPEARRRRGRRQAVGGRGLRASPSLRPSPRQGEAETRRRRRRR